MRVLIVDDEPIARKILREELELNASVTAIDEAADGAAALACLRQTRPDVLLLDLQMPGMSGFDVLREAGPGPVPIVITAFDQFAIPALDAGAVDYLLKPVSGERLTAALERAGRLLGRPAGSRPATAMSGGAPRSIVGRAGQEYVLLKPEEVLAFQADGDLVWILTARQKFQAVSTLRALAEKLAATTFRRVHRNALVNVAHVRKMVALSSQRWLLTMANGQEFIVSKRQARLIREILSA